MHRWRFFPSRQGPQFVTHGLVRVLYLVRPLRQALTAVAALWQKNVYLCSYYAEQCGELPVMIPLLLLLLLRSAMRGNYTNNYIVIPIIALSNARKYLGAILLSMILVLLYHNSEIILSDV